MNLFVLADYQLRKEQRGGLRGDYTINDVIDYAIKIRKHLDYEERGKAISKSKRRNKWKNYLEKYWQNYSEEELVDIVNITKIVLYISYRQKIW